MRIRIVTYSTKPRGGVVHALHLAEALADRGGDVELWALSADGARFFREPRVPARLVPVDRRPGEDVEPRILRYAAAVGERLGEVERVDDPAARLGGVGDDADPHPEITRDHS